MKKLFAILLSVYLLAALSVTAFAANINESSSDKTGSTSVTFHVEPTYTVTIPATVELQKDASSGNYKSDATVSAENVRLHEGEVINVTISGDFKLSTGAEGSVYELPYTVKVGASDTAITTGAIVATFDTDTARQSAILHFEAANPTYAGNYTDTVTFTIGIAAAS